MKVKLKAIYINSDYKGKPFITNKGEPYKKAVIVSESDNKATLFIWNNEPGKLAIVQGWKAGDTVEVEIFKSGKYTNFELPKVVKQIVAEDPRQDEPSQEQITEMFSNPNVGEKDQINPADIPF